MSSAAADVRAAETELRSAPHAAAAPLLPALLLLFVGSGCAALIYQIVWFEMLGLVIGSSAVSLGILLATFMGGMCIGSLYLSKVISPAKHPLKIYGQLEIGIGICGLVVLLLLPMIGAVYALLGGEGLFGVILRAVMCVVLLLPPTILMGATLPAIARWVETTPRGIAWLGFFYAGNIGGAVFGCLLTGFYLLRVHNSTVATLVAVALNFVVGGIGVMLSKSTDYDAPDTTPATTRIDSDSWPVYVTIGLSGLTALGAEVVWTRQLSLMFGATVYTFSLILAAVLAGLGIGSSIGSAMSRNLARPRFALGVCQLLLMAGLAWAAWATSEGLPNWPVNPNLSPSPWFTFQIDFVRALWTVIPAAILWGASFPLALAAVAERRGDPGEVVGGVYAANTVGAIIGSLVTALLFLGHLGPQGTHAQNSQRVLIVLAAISSLLMLAPSFDGATRRLRLTANSALWGIITLGLGAWFASTVVPTPGMLVAYGRFVATWLGTDNRVIFVGEGTHASLAVTETPSGVRNYHNAGKIQASSEPQDMRLQRLLGHLTTLVPVNPENPTDPKHVMVIGFGAGVTAGAVSIDPIVDTLTIVELERLVPETVSTYFSQFNFDVARNPKTQVHIDDARHYLLTTKQKFDCITSDPFDPWVKGAAVLYTREFFTLMKEHLNPGGCVTVFVQLYQAGLEAVKSEVATFAEVFPNMTVWANLHEGAGYDLVLVGQNEPTKIDMAAWDARLQSPEYAQMANSLAEIGVFSADDLVLAFGETGKDLAPWLADAQINTDRNLRLQYLAGMGLNRFEQAEIYSQMLQYRKYPEGLLIAPPERINLLRNAMGLPDFGAVTTTPAPGATAAPGTVPGAP
jgi:spermidine synthase